MIGKIRMLIISSVINTESPPWTRTHAEIRSSHRGSVCLYVYVCRWQRGCCWCQGDVSVGCGSWHCCAGSYVFVTALFVVVSAWCMLPLVILPPYLCTCFVSLGRGQVFLEQVDDIWSPGWQLCGQLSLQLRYVVLTNWWNVKFTFKSMIHVCSCSCVCKPTVLVALSIIVSFAYAY